MKFLFRFIYLNFFKFPAPNKVAIFPEDNNFKKNAMALAAESTTRIQRFTLDEETTNMLLQACRKAKTTITGAISAAVMQACADVIASTKGTQGVTGVSSTGELKIGIACGADTRKLYQRPIPSNLLAYHVSGVPMFARTIRPSSTLATQDKDALLKQLWDTSVDMRSHIQQALAHGYPLTIAGLVGGIWASNLKPKAQPAPKPFTVSLTNWGITPFQQSYGPNLRLVAMEPAVSMGHTTYPVVIASSAAGSLTVSVLTTREVIREAHAEAFVQSAHSNLLKMIGS